LNEKTGLIDYDKMEELADLYRPKLIVAGFSAYSRNLDFQRFRDVADKHNAYLLSDMAHISGLVAAGVIPGPFEHSDIVTTTTHKSLRGPRGAMIFFRKGVKENAKPIKSKTGGPDTLPVYDFESRINFSVFPSLQGGPHNHTIAAIATALKQAKSDEYKAYQQQVLRNAKTLSDTLMNKYKYELVSGGTDNHLLLINVKKSKNLDGAKVERVLELCNIACNKNTVPGDVSAMTPGGIRMGTPALTSRGFTEDDFVKVAGFFDDAVNITLKVNADCGGKPKDFKAALANATESYNKYPELRGLQERVQAFARSFPTIGF